METTFLLILAGVVAVACFGAGSAFGQSQHDKYGSKEGKEKFIAKSEIAFICDSLQDKVVGAALKDVLLNYCSVKMLDAVIEKVKADSRVEQLPCSTKPERYYIEGPNQHGAWQVYDSVTQTVVANRGSKGQAAAVAFARNSEEFKNG